MSGVLSIQNRQRTRAIDTTLLRRMLRSVLREHLDVADFELGLHLVEAVEMATVNQAFLQHEGSTDVITFDHAGPATSAQGAAKTPQYLHGEIFISVPDAVRQAAEFQTTWQAELIRYGIHGLLHLMGHDDLKPAARRRMKREENRLVAEISKVFPVSKIARPTVRKTSR